MLASTKRVTGVKRAGPQRSRQVGSLSASVGSGRGARQRRGVLLHMYSARWSQLMDVNWLNEPTNMF